LEERVRQRTAQLEVANRELESFSYSVSHDLRAPLRSVDGFSRALLEDYDAKLDDEGRKDLHAIRAAAQRMSHLIDAMLDLARVTRGTLHFRAVNLSELAQDVARELARNHPENKVNVIITPDVVVTGDAPLLHNVLENLLGNA
jgi:signal transduction histidine kinase